MNSEQMLHLLAGIDHQGGRGIKEHPWSLLGGTMATDGIALVWVDLALNHPPAIAGLQPTAEGYLRGNKGMPFPMPLSRLRAWVGKPVSGVCPTCQGKPTSPCEECGGDGELTCEYGHEHDCPDCRGTGRGCRTCDDTGAASNPILPGSINDLWFDRHRLAVLLARIPDEGEVEIRAWPTMANYGVLRVTGQGWAIVLCGLDSSAAHQGPALEESPHAA